MDYEQIHKILKVFSIHINSWTMNKHIKILKAFSIHINSWTMNKHTKCDVQTKLVSRWPSSKLNCMITAVSTGSLSVLTKKSVLLLSSMSFDYEVVFLAFQSVKYQETFVLSELLHFTFNCFLLFFTSPLLLGLYLIHYLLILLFFGFFFFLHSPAISLGFTTFGWDFCVCDRFF